jgi:hypothetical protein
MLKGSLKKFPCVIELSRGNHYFPSFEYWVPDYSDFSLPMKKDSRPFSDPEDYEAYLNWLVVHLENTDLPLNSYHQEIIRDLNIQNKKAELIGTLLGDAAISQYCWFEEPRFDYPEDFFLDPRPERVCDPASVEWDDKDYNEDGTDLVHGMIEFQTYLIFDFTCWQAQKEYDKKRFLHPVGAAIFSDIDWRPLLKVAISRTNDWWAKRKALIYFHDEFSYLCQK